MDNIWPNENQLRKDFDFDDSNSDKENHKEVKIQIAETTFEILLIASIDNLTNQEYIFFEFLPKV